MKEETFVIKFDRDMVHTINARTAALLGKEAVTNRLKEMEKSGKTLEEQRQWMTLLAISTLFGLPKADKDEQYNYLAGKLRDMAAGVCVQGGAE